MHTPTRYERVAESSGVIVTVRQPPLKYEQPRLDNNVKAFQIPGELKWHISSLFTPRLTRFPKNRTDFSALRVLFFSREENSSGATYLRRDQLSDVFSKIVPVELVSCLSSAKDSDLIIASKGSLSALKIALSRAKAKNLRVLYDPVDELFDPKSLCTGLTGLVACSYKQYLWLRGNCNLPIYCILHHVDYRINRNTAVQSGLKIGYLGALRNAFWEGTIGQTVEHIDARNPFNTSWIGDLYKFSVHYCIRRKREKANSFKPATKIYLAACLGVPVITTRDESDVEYLLPPDYPYFCEKRTEREVLELLDFVKSTFGSPIFEKASKDVSRLKGWDFNEQLAQVSYLLEVICFK